MPFAIDGVLLSNLLSTEYHLVVALVKECDMEELTLDQIPRKTRDLYEKAMAALERGNTGYALDMLKQVITVEPRFLLARKNLRIAQVKLAVAAKPNAMTHQLSSLKGAFTLMAAQGKLKKDPKAALDGAEKLLAMDPLNLSFLKFFAQAAEAAEMTELAVQTLEIARPYYTRNVDFLRLLAKLYIDTNQPGGAKDCYAAVVELRPNDQQAIKNLKDAAALDTMKAGNWTDMKSDFRSKLKDQKEAIRLEQQAKSVKGESDIDALIEDRLRDIQREPQNMNFRRALADLYVRAERFDEALQALADATEAAGRSDPQIERTVSQIKARQFDNAIAAAKAANDEAAVAAQEAAKAQFLYDDAVEMVKRYPNDLQFRYELGYQYYLRDQFNEAIEEFQLAQRNPQRRTRALYYLALCFTAKGQYDIAFEQLQKAASELTLMDDTKKDVVYEMGVLAEKMGRAQEATGYFKEIYAVDIKYRDIAQRIEAAYQKK
ncbi:MAG: hypothetical protein KBI43_02990 [Kiritimatiellae bacterium]|jgi:tetratricopeptide (TPR) repeat protein|nr:hypothetical protein [Kiritimatiellia bacterium]OQC55706.1 MAG: Tetratricopeptide repeat protein [Verrucomicrobia bacterium ADurb.Bin018]